MRLTLRTLLAYLDDTLEANQTRGIGEKVAESDRAQEIVERIKKVTRRRGIGAPAIAGDDDSTTDPNTVAEYLDNVLPAEQLSEVEEKALESNSRLAEIAACHQILTLVLGEPVRVPPTARQRMYRVVKGRESIPYRKSPPSTNVAGVADPDAMIDESSDDDGLLLGLTQSKRLIPIIGSLLLMILLGIAVWLALPATPMAGRQGYISVAAHATEPEPKLPKIVVVPEVGPPPRVAQEPKDVVVKIPRIDENKKPEVTEPKKVVVEEKKEPVVKQPAPVAIGKPDMERRDIARLLSRDTVVMQRKRGTDRWSPVDPTKPLSSTDTLVSLPGYHSDLLLDSGVQLRLWGNLPIFSLYSILDLLESRVILHVPPKDFDADFTLVSGRVYITRPVAKGQEVKPSKVRLRFKDEVWDLTLLDADTEIAIDLMGSYEPGVPFSKEPGGESPLAEAFLGLLKGRAGVHIGFKDFPMLPAPTRIDWENKKGGLTGPVQIKDKAETWWSTELPPKAPKELIKEFQAALAEVARKVLTEKAIPEVVFAAALKDDTKPPALKILAIYCMEAMDDIESLASALGDDFFFIRLWAVRATIHWTAQAANRDLIFYKMLMETKGYMEPQARTVMQLLHPFSENDAKNPATFATLFDYLRNEKAAVRELSLMRLVELDPDGGKEFADAYARSPDERREPIIGMWMSSWKRRSEKK